MKILLLILVLLFTGCTNKKFDPNKWKTNKNEQYYMLKDLVENNILLGLNKDEVISLLDTTEIKQFNYFENNWMFVISNPNTTAVTKNNVEIMDINFKKNNVCNVSLRN